MTRLLIAEDTEIIRTYIRETLEKDPTFSVVAEASSGREALELYFALSPDIILMDIEMEEADDGIKAADEILRRDPEAKVIYLTSHDADETVVKALSNGAKDYIVKGCDKETLRGKIHAVENGTPHLDPRIQSVVMGEYRRLRKSEKNLLYFIQNLGNLTPAEKELVSFFLSGMKAREIADARCVELATIKSQTRTLLQKFGVSRSSEVVKTIHELGLEHLFPPVR